MTGPEKLLKYLDESEQNLVNEHMKLIVRDAPKNQFAVITGKILAIRDVRDNLRTIFEG